MFILYCLFHKVNHVIEYLSCFEDMKKTLLTEIVYRRSNNMERIIIFVTLLKFSNFLQFWLFC